MNNDEELRDKPTFKLPTPEQIQKHREMMREAARRASENLKNGIYPENKKMTWTPEELAELTKRIKKPPINNLNARFDPEMMAIGTKLAAYHIEAGTRKFAAFVEHMVNDLGAGIQPYLKAFYKGAKMMPEMESFANEMDSDQGVDQFCFEQSNNNTDEAQSGGSNQMDTTQAPIVIVTINDPLVIPRIEWLRDNHPEYLLELLNTKGALEEAVLRVVKQARMLQVRLIKQGNLRKDEIQELVMNVIAPAEEMQERETENPISHNLLLRIIESLDD